MSYTQQVIYRVDLPEFLNVFKNECLGLVIPPLQSVIQYLQSPQVNHSSTFLIVTIFFVLLFRFTLISLSSSKSSSSSSEVPAQTTKSYKQLRKSIKEMKNTVKKLMQYSQQTLKNKEESSMVQNNQNNFLKEIEGIKNLIRCYRQTVQENEKIAQFIIDSHEQLLKEIKQIKRMKFHSEKSLTHSNASVEEVNICIKENSTQESSNYQSYSHSQSYSNSQQIENVKEKSEEIKEQGSEKQGTEETDDGKDIKKPVPRIPPSVKKIGKRNGVPPPLPKK